MPRILSAAGKFAIACFLPLSLTEVASAASNNAAPYGPIPPPDFSGFWQHGPIAVFESVPFKASPVQDRKGALDPAFRGLFEGDYANPNLQPWAAAEVKRHAEAAGKGEPLPTQEEVCKLSGVPDIMTLPAPVQFLQRPMEIVLLYQRDHQVRHIYLQAKHSAKVPSSWYGESIGSYEGDTLVVDTIGMNAMTPVDIFGTPHTEALHVVERYRIINGRQFEVVFTVSDPSAFIHDWTGRIVYTRANVQLLQEEVCAENDRTPNGVYNIPTETRQIF